VSAAQAGRRTFRVAAGLRCQPVDLVEALVHLRHWGAVLQRGRVLADESRIGAVATLAGIELSDRDVTSELVSESGGGRKDLAPHMTSARALSHPRRMRVRQGARGCESDLDEHLVVCRTLEVQLLEELALGHARAHDAVHLARPGGS
jgi:hypothetical protein